VCRASAWQLFIALVKLRGELCEIGFTMYRAEEEASVPVTSQFIQQLADDTGSVLHGVIRRLVSATCLSSSWKREQEEYWRLRS
jgi:hypothetical protein